jgi:hypothetical protein
MARFTQAGGVHVLNGVWRAGASDGSVTYRSRAAKEAAAARGHAGDTPSGNGLDPR